MRDPWNANIHYDARLAACVPADARAVLDVGCGDGFLAARLAGRLASDGDGARRVVALDVDEAVLERARSRFPDAAVDWCHGDVLSYPFEPGCFDAVVSNATLHHLPDTAAALRRLGALVRPGGVLAIVGLTRTERRDLPWPPPRSSPSASRTGSGANGTTRRSCAGRRRTPIASWAPMPGPCCPAPGCRGCSWADTCSSGGRRATGLRRPDDGRGQVRGENTGRVQPVSSMPPSSAVPIARSS